MRRGRTFHKLQWKLHISTKNRHFTKLILSKYKLSINPWLSPPVSANAALYGNCSCLLRNGKHSLCQNNCMVIFFFKKDLNLEATRFWWRMTLTSGALRGWGWGWAPPVLRGADAAGDGAGRSGEPAAPAGVDFEERALFVIQCLLSRFSLIYDIQIQKKKKDSTYLWNQCI